MKVWGMWHGGSSYSHPCVKDDVESFDSLAQAKRIFEDRYRYDLRYPCVTAEASMTVWFRDPRDERDPYPDRVIELGPRGGIRTSIC